MKRSTSAGRLGLMALAGFLLLAEAAQAQAQLQFGAGDTVRVATQGGSRVNVRGAPTTRSAVVGQVEAGGQVAVEAAQTQGNYVWYQVTTAGGVKGWIRGDLLERMSGGAVGAVPPVAPAPAAPQAAIPPTTGDDWTRFVPSLLREVDACINSLSLQPVIVTRVFQVEPDMVGVRLRDPSDRRWECLIGRNGNYPIRLDPLGDRVRPMPGDGNPMFVRAPGNAPSDPCLRADEIDDPASGRMIGWRAYRTCPEAPLSRP